MFVPANAAQIRKFQIVFSPGICKFSVTLVPVELQLQRAPARLEHLKCFVPTVHDSDNQVIGAKYLPLRIPSPKDTAIGVLGARGQTIRVVNTV